MIYLCFVLHIADGFALGAAVATDQVTVQVIVFLAVILHKVRFPEITLLVVHSSISRVIELVLRHDWLSYLLGACSFRSGLLSDACRPRKEVHSGTFTGLFSCVTYSCHRHLLHIKCSKTAH